MEFGDTIDGISQENGLSFSNPNYHLDFNRFDDALNSNTSEAIFEAICNLNLDNKSSIVNLSQITSNHNQQIDMNDLLQINDNYKSYHKENDNFNDNLMDELNCNKISNKEETVIKKTSDIENDYMNYINEKLNDDFSCIFNENNESKMINTDNNDAAKLPFDWEKHEDDLGPYYWHIPSGTIQREIPQSKFNAESKIENNEKMNVPRSCTSSSLNYDTFDDRKRKGDLLFKRRSFPVQLEPNLKEKSIRFAVRSLGWIEISESDLTPERSSKAVNKCIVDLSLGRKDFLDNVGRWGDGKDLYLDLDEGSLKLIDPENLTVLKSQPIHTIRVWGVGRDNGRDFAYVARDKVTRKHMCHVFRCDIAARIIANTLRDICKKIMIERSLQQNLTKVHNSHDVNNSTTNLRPTNLLIDYKKNSKSSYCLTTICSFPTPMEEPKKILKAQYLGSTQVPQATGIEIVHDAIKYLTSTISRDQWQNVNVAIAPSMISILKPQTDDLILECRVRYLSFLGIGLNVKHCAFIVHTAQDLFIAHVFYCEPSSGPLCKTIEAACKLRYQKCLDAHPPIMKTFSMETDNQAKTFKNTLKGILNSFSSRKIKQ